MSDEEFFLFLAACREELGEKQEAFQKRIIKFGRLAYEMANGSLTMGDTVFSMTPIGTFSTEHKSWLWAWANEDFPDTARDASKQLQSLHETTGFRVFIEPGISASLQDAEDFVALAVHHLEAIGFFRPNGENPRLYLAVSELGVPGERAAHGESWHP